MRIKSSIGGMIHLRIVFLMKGLVATEQALFVGYESWSDHINMLGGTPYGTENSGQLTWKKIHTTNLLIVDACEPIWNFVVL